MPSKGSFSFVRTRMMPAPFPVLLPRMTKPASPGTSTAANAWGASASTTAAQRARPKNPSFSFTVSSQGGRVEKLRPCHGPLGGSTRRSALCGSLSRRRSLGRFERVLLDELLDEVVRLVVGDLLRRRLHQVRARALERARDAVQHRELGEPNRVDDDPGRVRRG